MKTFSLAKWIWLHQENRKDEYCEFYTPFFALKKKTMCRLSCDGDYTLSINGKYISSNQYGDFEHYKIYDEIDITDYIKNGENEFSVLVWHMGEDSQRYINVKAGVIFEIEQGGDIILASSENILCRQNNAYESGYGKKITAQMGCSFSYDARKENVGEYVPATHVDKVCSFFKRPIRKLQLLSRKAMTVLKNKGNYYLIDLGEETVGLPILEFFSQSEQKILVAWGEDLQDGHVRRIIGDRDFSFNYTAKVGRNQYTNYMLRLGCRYLEVYAQEPIEIEYIGLIPQVYPVEEKRVKFKNELDQKIYDACVNTLKLCMMEHYVDTPWREQCLYVYDSRNQALCGYYVFEQGNTNYVRANLKLISQDRREDGLLSICYPCGMDLTIPSFSLYYFMQVNEYLKYTGDITLALEVYDKLISVLNVFIDNRKDGLVLKFEGKNHWNFYDWSPYLDGVLHGTEDAIPDLMVNLLFIIALKNLKEIDEILGKKFSYETLLQESMRCTKKSFYKDEVGLYSMTIDGNDYTVLGNAMAILAGLTSQSECNAICEKVTRGLLTDCSLSMKCFKYDALLATNKEQYKAWVLNEIRKEYGKMVKQGHTVWETIEGASAFDNAGSLCHGWSAIPVYYYHVLAEE